MISNSFKYGSHRPPPGAPVNPDSPLFPGLIADFTFSEVGGLTTFARSAGGTMTIQGTCTWVVGAYGSGINMDGVTGLLRMNFWVIDPAATDFTAAIWYYQYGNTSTWNTLISQENGTGVGRSWLGTQPTNMGLYSYLASAGAEVDSTVPGSILTWNRGVISRQGSKVNLYLNKRNVLTYTGTMESAGGVLRIGSNKGGGSCFYGNMGMGGFQLWNRALSQSDINYDFDNIYNLSMVPISYIGTRNPSFPGGLFPVVGTF